MAVELDSGALGRARLQAAGSHLGPGMSRLRRRPRVLVSVLLWVLILGLALVTVFLLRSQYQAAVAHVLERQHYEHEAGWELVRYQHRSRALQALQPYLLDPGQGQGGVTSLPDLQQRLPGLRDQLQDQGLGLLQLYWAEAETRHDADTTQDATPSTMQAAAQFGDLASSFEWQVDGLVKRLNVPLLDLERELLGSLRFSLNGAMLMQDLEWLWPERDFRLLIRREALQAAGLQPDRLPLQLLPGFGLFMMPGNGLDPSLLDPIVEEDPSAPFRALAARPDLSQSLLGETPQAARLLAEGVDYVLVPTPLHDAEGAPVGVLVAAMPEPALAALDVGLRVNALMAVLVILLLGLVSHRLLRVLLERAAERRRLSLITRSLGQGLYVVDEHGVITEVNARACALLGYEEGELLGRRAEEVLLSSEDQDRTASLPLLSAMTSAQPYSGEQRFRRKNGSPLQVLVNSVPLKDDLGSVGLFDDITRQKLQERQLRRIAHFDALTGLANRVLLAERLRTQMAHARHSNTCLALAFVDLDGFKAVNDTHGHEMGDRLLVRLGRCMQGVLRDTDTVARLGGDEFAVILTNISDPASYGRMLERLLDVLSQPQLIDGETLKVSASIGLSLYPQQEDIDGDQLLRQADQAMYEAKLAGKGRYRVFDPEQHADLRDRNELFERLRQALERSELRLYYQPCISLASGSLQAVEALIRWQHPEQGMLSPSAFLPAIRQHELEIDVGRWVLRNALQQLDAWQRKGLHITVSLNIAGEHFQHPMFLPELKAELARWPHLRPRQIQLELIESSALDDVDEFCRMMAACRELGVSVVLDDFGTGYCSLSYLKRLPVQGLKLDRGFVAGMAQEPEALAIVDGILRLADAFHLDVIAEGVETLEQGRLLRLLGCSKVQGYFVARPMPASGVETWLSEWSLPESWAGTSPLAAEGRELLYGLMEHRAWLRAFRAQLDQPREHPRSWPPPACQLGQRVRAGLTRSADKSAAAHLHQIHQEFHALAEELTELVESNQRHAAIERWPELERLSADLQAALDRLIQAGQPRHARSA